MKDANLSLFLPSGLLPGPSRRQVARELGAAVGRVGLQGTEHGREWIW